MKSAQASQSRGFTLIELLVTVAVLTILIVIALPSFFGAIDRRRVVDVTEAIGKQVEQARMTAIETNRPIMMVFDTAAQCFGLTDTDNAAGCDCTETNIAEPDSCTIPFALTLGLAADSRELVVGRAEQFPGVTMAVVPTTNLRFDPQRGIRIDGGDPLATIELTTARGLEAHVMVNIIGRVSTCSPAGASNVSVMKTCP